MELVMELVVEHADHQTQRGLDFDHHLHLEQHERWPNAMAAGHHHHHHETA